MKVEKARLVPAAFQGTPGAPGDHRICWVARIIRGADQDWTLHVDRKDNLRWRSDRTEGSGIPVKGLSALAPGRFSRIPLVAEPEPVFHRNPAKPGALQIPAQSRKILFSSFWNRRCPVPVRGSGSLDLLRATPPGAVRFVLLLFSVRVYCTVKEAF